jgi:hypothetical protein
MRPNSKLLLNENKADSDRIKADIMTLKHKLPLDKNKTNSINNSKASLL